MSIETQQKQAQKVREDLNRYRLKQDGQDGQDGQDEGAIAGDRSLHYEKKRASAPVARGPVPRMHSSRCTLRS